MTESLSYLSRMRPFKVVREDKPLVDLIKILAQGSHIVGITNSKNELLTVVTQGQLFQQVYKLLGKNFSMNIPFSELLKLGYITSPVVSIRNTAKAYSAFEMMSTANLSGLAVVNENGKIIHNTSATDIKLWLIASNTLEETIEQFLINIRKLSMSVKYPITVCGMDDMFSKGLAKLQATKYHRLWIIDKDVKPVAVLAITDFFRFILGKKKQNKGKDKK